MAYTTLNKMVTVFINNQIYPLTCKLSLDTSAVNKLHVF